MSDYEDWKTLFPISLQRFHDYLDYMASDRNTSVRSVNSFITYVNDLKKLHIRLGHKGWEEVFNEELSQRKMLEYRTNIKNGEKHEIKGLSRQGVNILATRRKPLQATALVEMPNIIPAGKSRSMSATGENAYSTRAPVAADEKNTRVSGRMTKGQKRDWRESSASYDETGLIINKSVQQEQVFESILINN
jgi:hypothetical protein